MHFASRGLSGLKELEHALGHNILKLSVSPRSKGRLIVNITLDDGSTLTLESQDTNEQLETAVRPGRG
jgi:hypothetical protein